MRATDRSAGPEPRPDGATPPASPSGAPASDAPDAASPPPDDAPGRLDNASTAPAPAAGDAHDPPRSRTPGRWRTVLVATLLAGLVAAATTLLHRADAPPAAQPTTSSPAVQDVRPLWAGMNDALARQDREAFLAHTSGAGRDALARWWDAMAPFGWQHAVVSPASGAATDARGPRADVLVTLGTDMGSLQRDADGDVLVLGYPYEVTLDLAGEAPVVVGWEPAYGARPWDVTDLEVTAQDGVLVAAPQDDPEWASLVAEAGAEASAWVLADHEATTGEAAPLEAFTVLSTADEEVYLEWLDGTGDDAFVWDPAALAVRAYPPAPGTPGLPDGVAAGVAPAGGLAVVGPWAGGTVEDLTRVLVHELAHVLQGVTAPTLSVSTPLATTEGWATYQELRFVAGGAYPVDGPVAEEVRACLAVPPAAPPVDLDFEEGDVVCAYVVASTVYAFAAQQGLDPAALATTAASQGVTVLGAAQRLGTPLSQDAWVQWLATTYG